VGERAAGSGQRAAGSEQRAASASSERMREGDRRPGQLQVGACVRSRSRALTLVLLRRTCRTQPPCTEAAYLADEAH
jgi:hypothetical protein